MKQKDKQMISQLEKKLKAEQEARAFVEKQLMEEKKRKKLEEATAARAVAFAAATRYCVLPQLQAQLQKITEMSLLLLKRVLGGFGEAFLTLLYRKE